MAQGFELLISPTTNDLVLKCHEHDETVWRRSLQILPDGRLDTSSLKCYEKHARLIDNPYPVLG